MHRGSHFSYARTLYWHSVVPALRRDWPMARQRAEQLIDLARERGFSMLLALRGAALEETETAPREIRDGIAAFRATGCRYQTAEGALRERLSLRPARRTQPPSALPTCSPATFEGKSIRSSCTHYAQLRRD